MGTRFRPPTVDRLAALALFGGISTDGLLRLVESAVIQSVDAGDVVFREGDVAKDVYVIVDGAFDVVRQGKHKEIHIAALPVGDFFGEMSLVDMKPRAGTVRARSDAVLWRWPYTTLHTLYLDDPKAFTLLIMNIAREISRRLRRSDERLLALTDTE